MALNNESITDTQTVSQSEDGSSTNSNASQKTYSQSDIDAIAGKIKHTEREKLAKTLEIERQKAIEEWREENGLSEDVLKTISTRDTTQIEIKKRDKAIQKYEQELNALSQKLKDKESLLHSHISKSTVFKHAIEQNTIDPEIVYVMLKDDIVVDDSGNAIMRDGASVNDAIRGLLNAKPHLVKSTVDSGGGGVRGGGITKPSDSDLKTIDGRRKALEKLIYG